MIHSFKHKGLKAFASNGTTTGINPSHAKKLRKLLGTLQQVRHLGELSNGFGLHRFHRNSRRKPPNSFGWRNAANLSLPIYLVVPDERRVSFHPLC